MKVLIDMKCIDKDNDEEKQDHERRKKKSKINKQTVIGKS